MFHFLTAHLKSILTTGFIIGLVSLIVKFIDEGLSATKKNRIDHWVRDVAPKLRAMTVDDFVIMFKNHSRWLAIGGAAIATLAADIFWLKPKTFGDFLGSILLTGIPSFVGTGWVFGAPTLKQIKFRAGFAVIATVVSAGLSLALIDSRLGWVQWIGIVLMIPTVFGLPYVVGIALITAIYFIVLGPVLMFARLLSWLSLYPKGPWAGIVALVTMALGILRLFM